MPRRHDDSWDITESVGITALGVAAARASETESADPLIRDPFAQLFLDAAGDGPWSFYFGPRSGEDTELDAESEQRRRVMIDYMACRTAFFDEFFLNATESGIRQIVIVASGLDSRAWRLPWPDGVVVYEIDQPRVLEFKSATMHAGGAEPACTRVEVAVDLRRDWPTTLRDKGFDTSAPSAWSTEGLLPYLPADAQDLLFERIDALSCPDARLAIESLPIDFPDSPWVARRREQMERQRAAAAKAGRTGMPNVPDLWYFEKRTDVAAWLQSRGWQVSVEPSVDLLDRYRRLPPDDLAQGLPPNKFVTARRGE
ncbi:MAG TPA: class I SAM-dependent methyltransferase [Mycobacterium sp.]|nr:class I SAM-dependent methyltransferase [Mycobacterium sp.]